MRQRLLSWQDPNTGKDFAKAAEVKGAIAYDKTKAKKLFKEGMKEVGEKKLKLQWSQMTLMQLSVQPNSCNPKWKSWTAWISTLRSYHLSNVWLYKFVIPHLDSSTFLDLYTKDSSFNNGSWDNAEYNKLMSAAKTTDVNDEKKRYDDYKQAEQIIDKEVGVAPLYYRSYATLFRTSVKGVVTNPAGAPYDWKWAYKN